MTNRKPLADGGAIFGSLEKVEYLFYPPIRRRDNEYLFERAESFSKRLQNS